MSRIPPEPDVQIPETAGASNSTMMGFIQDHGTSSCRSGTYGTAIGDGDAYGNG